MPKETPPTKIVHGWICPAHGLVATIEHGPDEHPPIPREGRCNVATWAGDDWQVCPALPIYTTGLSFDPVDGKGEGVDGAATVASLPAGLPAGGANPPDPKGTPEAPANTVDPTSPPEAPAAPAPTPGTGAVV